LGSSIASGQSEFSDASGLACGAYVQSDSDLVFHQNWSPAESVQSSAWRELKAVCLALEDFASRLSDSKVIWYCDNQNVESILHNSSKKSYFQELAFQAFHICLEYRISLDVNWIPRDINETADSISMLIDFDDYALSDVIFQEINSFWGPHGATTAANSGVNDRVFQRHGRWKSVQAKDTYVDDDLARRLSVSKFLGL